MSKYFKYIPFLLFAISLLGNLQYPLLWNDEAECAMHSKRVLEFGYPKVHNGKNTVYPIRHNIKNLAIDEQTDAYTGIGWVMFYYGTIGVKLAEFTNDLYSKTLFLRLPFALLGLLGLLIFYNTFSKLLLTEKEQFIFSILFFVALTLHTDFALHLREMRYYSLIIFISSVSFYLFVQNGFFTIKTTYLYVILQTILLWLFYNTFPPMYIILVLSYFIIELVIWKTKGNTQKSILSIMPLIFSGILLIPILLFFDSFNFSSKTAEFYNFNIKVYLVHLRDTFLYFFKFGKLEWIVVLIGILSLFYVKQRIILRKTEYALIGLFLFSIIYFLIINFIPHFVFTRYLLLLIVVETALFSMLLLVLYKQLKTQWFYIVTILAFSGLIYKNSSNIEGRFYELTHQYKGSLDYEIPYLIDKYKFTDKLIVATNYEECSYMYYLNAKVIMGFVLNNLEDDLSYDPDVVIFRHDWTWNYEKDVFYPLLERGEFTNVEFPVYDYPYNNISEYNLTDKNHLFKTKLAVDNKEKAFLLIRKYQ